MKQSSKCALGGLVAALSLVMMISVAIIPFLTYALPAAAGMLIVFMVVETDKKWAFGVYCTVAILGMLLVPDKEVAVMYLAFFGYYPIIKAAFESKLNNVIGWILKVAAFVATMVIIPAVFAFGSGSQALENDGSALIFIQLTNVFNAIPGGAGRIVGVLFFVLVFFAAVTSSVSLVESIVAVLCEDNRMKRAGHFSSVKLVGGDASAKQADMTLYSYMLEARERGYDVETFFHFIFQHIFQL